MIFPFFPLSSLDPMFQHTHPLLCTCVAASLLWLQNQQGFPITFGMLAVFMFAGLCCTYFVSGSCLAWFTPQLPVASSFLFCSAGCWPSQLLGWSLPILSLQQAGNAPVSLLFNYALFAPCTGS